MEFIIDNIIKLNEDIFGKNPNVEKINIGFTNAIYNVNNKFIIKICTNVHNEENFKKEIEFYKSNTNNALIPKLYYSSTDKKDIPYFYEIIEKIEGVTLYNVWHTFSEEQREDIIRQLCDAMKIMHSNKGESYNWMEYLKNIFIPLFEQAKEKKMFDDEQINLIENVYCCFEQYLESNEFVLIHNDLHFDNIFINNGTIKIIDFERAIYAPKDFELDILYRMIRKPWKFASEETEEYTNEKDYSNIMTYIAKYYPELINVDNLYKRLAIYDMIYFLEQYVEHPEYEDLKEDVLNSAKEIIKNRGDINESKKV